MAYDGARSREEAGRRAEVAPLAVSPDRHHGGLLWSGFGCGKVTGGRERGA